MFQQQVLTNSMNDLDTEYWEVKDNQLHWSLSFLETLGYKESDVKMDIIYFLKKLIVNGYREEFRDNFFNLIKNDIDFKFDVQILCKDKKFKEFSCFTNNKLAAKKASKLIFFKEKKIKTNNKVRKDSFYFKEAAEMTKTGSWYVDFKSQKSYWDQQTRKILDYPEDYIPSLSNSYNYYAEEHHGLAAKCFIECATQGIPFDIEIKMLTGTNKTFWARAIGKPIYNNTKEIIGVRGIFQDIDEEKSKILALQKTSNIIASQNSRLFNFAHIVSHNLRSHSSNLTLITEMIDDVDSIEEKLEMLDSIKDISESLNTTIHHLNEVVTIQTQTKQSKVEVHFDTTLELVKKSIGEIIIKSKTKFKVNFDEMPSLDYIPAYLESILLNLITNSIKYKHEARNPEISIKTYIKDKRKFLEFKDNGVGIDMQKFGNKIFGMYKTFHYNKDAVGVGLFLTKNQVESLNGKISVDSEVNKGTTFTIQF